MGLADRLRGMTAKAQKDLATKAVDAAAAHKEQIQEAVSKVEAAADQRTGGQYRQQITNAGAKVNAYVGKLPDSPATDPGAQDGRSTPAGRAAAAEAPAAGPTPSAPAAGEPPAQGKPDPPAGPRS